MESVKQMQDRLYAKMAASMANPDGMWDGLTAAMMLLASGHESPEAAAIMDGMAENMEAVALAWEAVPIDDFHPTGNLVADDAILERVVGLALLSPLMHDRGIADIETLVMMWVMNANGRSWRFVHLVQKARELTAFLSHKSRLDLPHYSTLKVLLHSIAKSEPVNVPMARWSKDIDETLN